MTNNFNVQGFLDALEQNTNQTNYENQNNGNARTLDKLYLSFPGNYGKYQIMPMVSTVTGQPFEFLNKMRNCCISQHIRYFLHRNITEFKVGYCLVKSQFVSVFRR